MPLREVFTLSEEDARRLHDLDDFGADYSGPTTAAHIWRIICLRNNIDYDTLKVWSDKDRIKFSAESLTVSPE